VGATRLPVPAAVGEHEGDAAMKAATATNGVAECGSEVADHHARPGITDAELALGSLTNIIDAGDACGEGCCGISARREGVVMVCEFFRIDTRVPMVRRGRPSAGRLN